MVEALIGGVGGVLLGTLLGGTGKYWLLRRDAWSEARTSGLLLLADVCALYKVQPDARIVSDTELGVRSWESHRQVLAGFRRGNFPNGFQAAEWLELAGHFAQLKELLASQPNGDADWWSRAQAELGSAELLLARFEHDPRVFGYVVRATLGR